MAIPLHITAQDIKGAWLVEIDERSKDTVRTIRSFAPNPAHVPSNNVQYIRSAGLQIARLIIHGLSVLGFGIEAYNLYPVYQHGQKTGNYNPFYREVVRVTGGITGAMSVGTASAAIGAAAGLPFGPLGPPVAGLIFGLLGAMEGYCKGGIVAVALLDSDNINKILTTFRWSLQSLARKIPKKLNLAPRKLVIGKLGPQLEKYVDKVANCGVAVADKILETQYVEHTVGSEIFFEPVQVPVLPEPKNLPQSTTDDLAGLARLDELTAALSTQLISTAVASSFTVATPVLFANRPSMVAVMSDRMRQQADLATTSQIRPAKIIQPSLFTPVTISCPRLDTIQQSPDHSSYASGMGGLLTHAFTPSFSRVMQQSSIQQISGATAQSPIVSRGKPLKITITPDPNGSLKTGEDGQKYSVPKNYIGQYKFI
jgi:hypothetical protein